MAPILLATVPAPGGAQGITVRVAPELSSVQWHEETALADATFLGAGISLGFGRYVTLRGSYRRAGTLETAFADAGFGPAGSLLEENRVTTSLFSSTVLFRLGDGTVAPVISAKGGVLQLEPEGRGQVRQILVGFGGGLDVRLAPWLDGQVMVEDVRLRLDRGLLARPEATPVVDPDRGVARRGLGVTASLGMRAGAGRASERADDVDEGFGRLLSGDTEGLMVPVEAQVGVVRFDEALGIPDQRTAGLRGGVDFGPYFGVRGQYWRGVADAFDEFRGLSGWTGEVQFNVGKVTGAAPYLLLGYGQTRFTDDFRSEVGVGVEDQNALVLGVGAGVPLGDRARLTVTLRDFVTTAGSFDDAASTGDLRHSFGLTGGISVLLAGRRSPAPLPPRSAPGREGPAIVPGDSADYRTGQVIAIPVPREGEIYLRYGPTRTLPDSVAAPPPGADTTPTPLPELLRPGATADASLEELRRQVEELARLVQLSLGAQAAGLVVRPGGTTVTVVGAPGEAPASVATAPEPLVRAVEGRLGRTSLDGNGGLGIGAEIYLPSLGGEGWILPFAGVELARADVSATWRGAPVSGKLTAVATDFGIAAVLPGIGPIWPTAGVLFTAVNGRASGRGAVNQEGMDRLYDGLSVGAGFALGAGYRPDPDRRTLITTSLRRIWAGEKSRWNVQAGARLVFGDRRPSPRPGPFSVRRSEPAAPVHGAPTPGGAADSATLLARLEALEAQVRAVTEEREAALAEARAAQARADSLAAMAEAAARAADETRLAAGEAWTTFSDAVRALAAEGAHVLSTAETDQGIRIVLGGDLFPVGATEPVTGAGEAIRRLAVALAPVAGASATVEGHTDGTGTAEANLVISRLRAEAVGRLLVAGGAPAGSITTVGRGQDEPVADNATRAGRAQNRRVEILVHPPPPEPGKR